MCLSEIYLILIESLEMKKVNKIRTNKRTCSYVSNQMTRVTGRQLPPVTKVSKSDLCLAIDLALIDEQERKVDLFGLVAAVFYLPRGEKTRRRAAGEM